MWRVFSISFTIAMLALLGFGFLSLVGIPQSDAKLQRVDADFNAITAAIKTYRLNTGRYPTTEEGLKALVEQPITNPPLEGWRKVAAQLPADPWGSTYRYRLLPEGHSAGFEIISAGKDREFGTEDDLSSQDP
jgi:general secretion pathway protein G